MGPCTTPMLIGCWQVKEYTFNRVFSPESTQEEIYKGTTEPLVDALYMGKSGEAGRQAAGGGDHCTPDSSRQPTNSIGAFILYVLQACCSRTA